MIVRAHLTVVFSEQNHAIAISAIGQKISKDPTIFPFDSQSRVFLWRISYQRVDYVSFKT